VLTAAAQKVPEAARWVSDISTYEEDSMHLDAFLFSFSIRHVTASVIKIFFLKKKTKP
jgi:hypothetical protein